MNGQGLWFRLRVAWRVNLWMLPALIIAGGVVLGLVMVLLDPSIGAVEDISQRLFAVSSDGAREVLSAIATSMLSVAGVVFSITIATLSLTSQQFTSRVLRTFVQDRGNQMVLGVFLGVFAYCLVVLRTVHTPSEGGDYVPEAALLLAIGLALVAVGFLVYFIDHVASSIQASTIVARVAEDTVRALRDSPADEPLPERLRPLYDDGRDAATVLAGESGYVRSVDLRRLAEVAAAHGWRLRVLARPGAFIAPGDALFRVLGEGDAPARPSAAEQKAARRAVWLASSRDINGDPGFGVRQLVDIALKALSPGVNDVTTAVTCVDHLGPVLLAARDLPARVSARDGRGEPRVAADAEGFADLLAEATEQITENGAAHAPVLLRQLAVLHRLSDAGLDAGRRALVTAAADRVEAAAARALSSPDDRRRVARAAALVRPAGGSGSTGGERRRAA